jgi:hypothetical protein
MKNCFTRTLTWILLLALFCFAATSCVGTGSGTPDDQQTAEGIKTEEPTATEDVTEAPVEAPANAVAIYFENGTDEAQVFVINLSDYAETATLYDVLKADADLQAEMDETSTPYVTSLCGVTPDSNLSQYIAIYTSRAENAWGDAVFEAYGTTFYYAAVGVAELPLVDGAVYVFRVESWQ